MSDLMNNSTTGESSRDPVDAIADMFVSEDDTEEVESTEEESEYTNDDTLEDEDSDQSELEDDDEESSEPSEGEYSLADVAEVLGLDEKDVTVDEDGNLLFKTKIDGKVSTVSLADLKKGYQMESSYTQRSQALAEEKKEFETIREQVAERLATQLQQAEGLAQMMYHELTKEYESVNWDELRQYDPAEYTAKRYDFEQRQKQLQQAAQYATVVQQQQQEHYKHVAQEALAEQWNKMIENNPQWSDQDMYTKDMTAMRNFASERYGFTDEDFAEVRDARLIELIKDAMAFNQGKKTTQQVTQKKVKRQAPKLQRAKNGQFMSKKTSKLDKLVKAAKSAKGGNKRDLEASAVTELLLNGG
jgi:hypothetical protein